ncbi:MAG: DUF4446 family protein [Patescibacteria group bacterium]
MVFNQELFLWIVTGSAIVWVAALTWWIWSRERAFKKVVGRVGERDIRKLLGEFATRQDGFDTILKNIEAVITDIKRADLTHLQKIGLVRFNPFRDAGGNQSFTLALLNEQYSGVVITGLHARDTTRLYVKDVIKGQSRAELSKEEKQALELAKK